MSAPSPLELLAGAVAFVFLARVAFNWVVDPLDLNGCVRIKGFNARKPRRSRETRLWKSYAVRRLRPEAIVLGNSRSEHAIDPESCHWPGEPRRRFNYSVCRARMFELRRFLEHAAALGRLKQVLIGVDFGSFDSIGRDPEMLWEVLATHRWDPLPAHLRRLGLAAGSHVPSRKTVRTQGIPLDHLDSGRSADFHYLGQARGAGGVNRLFLRWFEQSAKLYWRKIRGWAEYEGALGEFRQILLFCRERGIDLRLFLLPVHAQEMEYFRLVGRQALYEEWKRALTAIVADVNQGASESGRLCLWDFTGYHAIAREEVPSPGEERLMRYFWDASHCTVAAGELVLDRIFGSGALAGEDFGVILTPENVDAVIAEARRGSEAYRAVHEGELAVMREILGALERLHGPSAPGSGQRPGKGEGRAS